MSGKKHAEYSLTLWSSSGYGMSFLRCRLAFQTSRSDSAACRMVTCTLNDISPRLRRQMFSAGLYRLQIFGPLVSGRKQDRQLQFDGEICYVVASRTSAASSVISFQAIEGRGEWQRTRTMSERIAWRNPAEPLTLQGIRHCRPSGPEVNGASAMLKVEINDRPHHR